MQRNVRPTPAVIAARKREIAKRYKDHAKRKSLGAKPLTLAAVRIAELTRLFDRRYGPVLLPDSDEGVICARIVVHHLARLRDAPRRISDWMHTCAPWLSLASRERLIREAIENPMRWGADKLGWKLKITIVERTELKLRTIGAMGQTADQRKQAAADKRRGRQRIYQSNRRRANGAKPRAEYEAGSISKSKPWEALHMSRTQWYRAGKPSPETTASPHISPMENI